MRQTELSKATCHALLASLVDARLLLRHPAGPSYRLGPGLIALGEAARLGFPELPFAQDEMRALGTELGLECLASAVVDGEIVILAKHGVPMPASVSAAIGQRVPLVPPLATVFFAWSDESTISRAFGTGPLTPSYRAGLRAVRERGFAVGLENPARERLGRTYAARLARGQLTGEETSELVRALADEDYQLIDVETNANYWLSHLAAPVFDASGKVSLALTLVGFTAPLQAHAVHGIGRQLRTAADQITLAVHGAPLTEPADPADSDLEEVFE